MSGRASAARADRHSGVVPWSARVRGAGMGRTAPRTGVGSVHRFADVRSLERTDGSLSGSLRGCWATRPRKPAGKGNPRGGASGGPGGCRNGMRNGHFCSCTTFEVSPRNAQHMRAVS